MKLVFVVLRSKINDWLIRSQDYVSEWSNMVVAVAFNELAILKSTERVGLVDIIIIIIINKK